MTKTPHPDDVIVGANLRQLRMRKGASQEKLAENLGITFQQVQKYEKGTNRVSSSRLVAIARFLGCTLEDLFAGTGTDAALGSAPASPHHSAQALRLVTAFDRIEDAATRRHVVGLVEALAPSFSLPLDTQIGGGINHQIWGAA
ncbi:helix-turn-helix domain-containing protein [Rhizobium straminoryzae]|uniref:Helix-turn-helix transcriptional regulator n=1 Tax=Rhizobium straminoryzae TaxID=1387186 RepID=A0A549TD02_9HYPH|nr:helix-turn-helix transcriptional regulator [Rhizobium straminoryzae]TRL39857.1 helix-turn-helix transcriptional regulator [Rhizobium straminoryzae]